MFICVYVLFSLGMVYLDRAIANTSRDEGEDAKLPEMTFWSSFHGIFQTVCIYAAALRNLILLKKMTRMQLKRMCSLPCSVCHDGIMCKDIFVRNQFIDSVQIQLFLLQLAKPSHIRSTKFALQSLRETEMHCADYKYCSQSAIHDIVLIYFFK